MKSPDEWVKELSSLDRDHDCACVCIRCKSGTEIFLIAQDIRAVQEDATATLTAENERLKAEVKRLKAELAVCEEALRQIAVVNEAAEQQSWDEHCAEGALRRLESMRRKEAK